MHPYAESLRKERHFLQNVLKDFIPEHENFRPTPEMWTTAQQIRHIARTINWFKQGGFENEWDMNFEGEMAEMAKPVTLAAALKELNDGYDSYIPFIGSKPLSVFDEPLPENALFPAGTTRSVIIFAQADHTAHHRGILTVYLRLLGIVPTMVYL